MKEELRDMSKSKAADAKARDGQMDKIAHPSHYADGRRYEPKDVIRDWGLNFNLGNVVKYIARAGRKGDALEDLSKARQYLDFEIEALTADANETGRGAF